MITKLLILGYAGDRHKQDLATHKAHMNAGAVRLNLVRRSTTPALPAALLVAGTRSSTMKTNKRNGLLKGGSGLGKGAMKPITRQPSLRPTLSGHARGNGSNSRGKVGSR